MSHGKSNNNQTSGVDRLNSILSRLMGKRDKLQTEYKTPKTPKVSTNQKFAVVFLIMSLFLWVLTGIYYIPVDQSAIILNNGHIVKTVKGMIVSFERPYPFSNVVMIDNSNNALVVSAESSPLNILDKDNLNKQLSVAVDYQINSPQKYFLSIYQDNADLDKQISLIVKENIQRYFLNLNDEQLSDIGKAVIENEIMLQTNDVLRNFGINLNKLIIEDVIKKEQVTPITRSSNANAPIIQEAEEYAIWKSTQIKNIQQDFNNLLPQYEANPKTISELLYYRMLASNESSMPEFSLLNFASESTVMSVNSYNSRTLNRTVNRERIFENR